jgi:hypothetical protein
MKGPKPKNLIVALVEGVLGYLIYQHRCGLYEAYSEYLLYDPIVRIAKDKQWKIKSEFAVEEKKGKGDKKRIDFLFTSKEDENRVIALEVKYLKDLKKTIDLSNDIDKLKGLNSYLNKTDVLKFILIAGLLHEPILKKLREININLNGKGKSLYYDCLFIDQHKKQYGVVVIQV